jgi:hypothetical protein
MKILIFNRNGYRPVVSVPTKPNLNIEYVSFESNVLDDLMLVAKYKILNFPTSLIIDNNGKVLLKVKGMLSENYISCLSGENVCL